MSAYSEFTDSESDEDDDAIPLLPMTKEAPLPAAPSAAKKPAKSKTEEELPIRSPVR